MPASPASIPNDCFSWHTACLVDIHSPSANERNVETSHRLIRRPATRIDSLWHCASRLDGADPVSRPKCMSLACHKKNLEGSAHFTWFGVDGRLPSKVESANDRAARPRPAAISWSIGRAAKLHSPNFNITWMSRCSESRDVICKGQMSTGERPSHRPRILSYQCCRIEDIRWWHSRTTDKESREFAPNTRRSTSIYTALGAARELLR